MDILTIFALPLWPRAWWPLALYRDKIHPKLWLCLFGLLVAIYLSIQLFLYGFIEKAKDIPNAITQNYIQAEGTVERVTFRGKYGRREVIVINGTEYVLDAHEFQTIWEDEYCKIYMLPNSKYIIDVTNENGSSYLKRPWFIMA